jgi:hypothetical protein
MTEIKICPCGESWVPALEPDAAEQMADDARACVVYQATGVTKGASR